MVRLPAPNDQVLCAPRSIPTAVLVRGAIGIILGVNALVLDLGQAGTK